MTTIDEMATESQGLLDEETLPPTLAWLEREVGSADPIAPARGFVAGTLLGSAFWAVALTLVQALPL